MRASSTQDKNQTRDHKRMHTPPSPGAAATHAEACTAADPFASCAVVFAYPAVFNAIAQGSHAGRGLL
jgi:hypothetical protein